MTKVVVVGSINLDLRVGIPHFPEPGETMHALSRQLSPGGKGANQALAARLAGAEVSFVGAVGDDADSSLALQLLREHGVGLDHLVVTEAATGMALVMVATSGENEIIVMPGANFEFHPEHVESLSDELGRAAVVVFQGESPRATMEAAARLVQGRLILNLAPVMELDPEVIRRADPLVVNELEGRATLAMLGVDAESDTDEGVLLALEHAGCRSVVMTLGSRGALVRENGSTEVIPAHNVSAVDTTGAGDAFVGVLAARLAAGEDLRSAAVEATRFAAGVIQHAGAQASYVASVAAG